MSIIFEGPSFAKSSVCVAILRSLPDWFGMEEGIAQYSREIDHLPTWLASEGEHLVGFLSVKQHTPYSAEVYVMGILPEHHRKGIGRQLINLGQNWLKNSGVEYLQVKTLGPSNPDESYAKTREFYMAVGFRPLEEFKQIWDENNPCLVMVKRLN